MAEEKRSLAQQIEAGKKAGLELIFQTERSAFMMGTWEGDLSPVWELELDHQPQIKVMGRICHQRRDVGFFSDESKGYRYSSAMAKARPLTPWLRDVLKKVNTLCQDRFNALLVNYYADGTNYIGKHADDERNLGTSGVFAISAGAERTFRIRDKADGEILFDIGLGNQVCCWMMGDFQKEFTHEIPQQKRIKEPRCSITCRYHAE